MNYRERMKEYLKEPDGYSSQYGKWGILNREQRDLIKKLLREMDSADEVVKHQYFEIERLNENNQAMQEEMARTWKKLDKAIEYINNHQLVFEVSSKKQIAYWFDMFYKEPIEILDKENK